MQGVSPEQLCIMDRGAQIFGGPISIDNTIYFFFLANIYQSQPNTKHCARW